LAHQSSICIDSFPDKPTTKKKHSHTESLVITNTEDPSFVLSAFQELSHATFNLLEYHPSLHDLKVVYDSYISKSRWSALFDPHTSNLGKFVERDLHLGYYSPLWEFAKRITENPDLIGETLFTEYSQPSNSSELVVSIIAKFIGIPKSFSH
jgi:hypothetical protein